MAVLVRDDGASVVGGIFSTDTLDASERQAVVLSDGTRIVAVFGYATRKWYLYYTTDDVNFVLKWTSPVCSSTVFSIAVEDAGDHLGVLYQTAYNNLTFERLVKSAGPTYTSSGAEVISAGGTLYNDHADLDALNGAGAYAVVFRVIDQAPTPRNSILNVRARSTAGAWGAVVQIDSVANTAVTTGAVTCSAAGSGASGGSQRVLVAGVLFPTKVIVGTVTVVLATGVVSGYVASDGNSNFTNHLNGPTESPTDPTYNSGRLQAFRRTPTNSWYLVSSVLGPDSSHLTIKCFRIDFAAGVTTIGLQVPTQVVPASVPGLARAAVALVHGTSGTMNKVLVFFYPSGGNYGTVSWIAIDMDTLTTVLNQNYIASGAVVIRNWSFVASGAQSHVGEIADIVVYDYANADAFVEYNQTPGIPTAITPADGATVNTNTPTLSATLPNTQTPAEYKHKAVWQSATNSLFTTGLVNTIEVDSDSDLSAVHNETSAPITEGVKYLRAATMDPTGRQSAWSAYQSFTNSHTPLAFNMSPSSGKMLAYGAGSFVFDWDFTDPSLTDTQSAYQIIIEVNGSGAPILDTGKVASTATTATLAIAAGYKDQDLRWKIRVWNNNDTVGVYSSYQIFGIGDIPTVSVTAPVEGSTISNPQPLVAWTFAASGGRTQKTYRVRLIQDFAPSATVYDSGVISGSATSFQVPGYVLENGKNYLAQVDVTDSSNLPGTDSNHFTATWALPASISSQAVSASDFSTLGYVRVTWTNSDQDIAWMMYRVYRRTPSGTGDWELIYSTTTGLVNYTYDDHLARSGQTYDYAVVQVAVQFGSFVESARVAMTPGGSITNGDYWLIDPDDATNNILLSVVTEDSFKEEYESETLNLIGRGRKKDYGDRWGYSGSLSAQVWDDDFRNVTARQTRLAFEKMKGLKKTVYLKTPFGDVWEIALEDAEVGRLAGVGTREFHTLKLPYTEVS